MCDRDTKGEVTKGAHFTHVSKIIVLTGGNGYFIVCCWTRLYVYDLFCDACF